MYHLVESKNGVKFLKVAAGLLFALSLNAHGAPKEFVIETRIEGGRESSTSYRIRVAEGEQASLSTYGADSSTKTTLKVSATDLGENEHGESRVELHFDIERSTPDRTFQNQPQITTLIGKATTIELGTKGEEPLRMMVRALRR